MNRISITAPTFRPKGLFLSPLTLGAAAVFVLSACDVPKGIQAVPVHSEPVVLAEPSLSADTGAPASKAAPAPRSKGTSPTRPRTGVITAGDIDDALNLAEFQRYAARAAKQTGLPASRLGRPVRAQLVTPEGTPLPNMRVTLRRKGKAEPFYDGYSGVDGRVTVFPTMHGSSSAGTFELRAFRGDQQGAISAMLTAKDTPLRLTVPGGAADGPDFLDLMFVIDTTGSMGDELAWITKELRAMMRQVKRQAGDIDVNYGLVVYRDQGDAYVVRNFGIKHRLGRLHRELRRQTAAGGGDYPEAAAQALSRAVSQRWRRGNGKRLLFHIADAPPHSRDARAYIDAAAGAAKKNVQIFGLGASGVAAESEYLMRQAALATGGRYIFLTDDSGVGHSHAEPSISCYRVTALKGLLARILVSELTGKRQEAPSSEVIREVGTYQNGVCKN